jgi:hypothetical protein
VILNFQLHAARYAIAVMDAGAPLPAWPHGRFMVLVRTDRELTVVCDESSVPAEVRQQRGLRCLEIVDTFELASVGVVTAAAKPIADAGISLFAYSTWSADCLLVSDADIAAAILALKGAGHGVR